MKLRTNGSQFERCEEFGETVEFELKPGDRGAFEVYVDEEVIFSKLHLNFYSPTNEEIVQLIKDI